MNKAIILILTILACFAFTPSYAASFDCSKAKTKFEKQICANAELSKLDEELSAAYKKEIENAYPLQELIDDQRAWLKYVKKSCASLKCLQKVFSERIDLLKSGFTPTWLSEDDEEHENTRGTLALKCDYQEKKPNPIESISIVQAFADKESSIEYVNEFKRGIKSIQHMKKSVNVLEDGECVFPSGNSVKIRVGVGEPSGYGKCGADPDIYVSIWINQRIVISRHWYAGHCISETDYQKDSFKVSNGKLLVCKSIADYVSSSVKKFNRPFAQCKADAESEIDKHPIDRIEYPLPGTKLNPPGTIEILKGGQPVCNMVAEFISSPESSGTPSSLYHLMYTPSEKVNFNIVLPKTIEHAGKSVYDFNNDGLLDLVLSDSPYRAMDGDILLVQFGKSPDRLKLSDEPILGKDSMLLTCQMDAGNKDIKDCPPLGNDAYSGFEVQSDNGQSIFFQSFYSHIFPFQYENQSFIAVYSRYAKDYVAVIKPLPNRAFEKSCLIHTVPKNF